MVRASYPGASAETIQKSVIIPVSYTHLDVYKRQLHTSAKYSQRSLQLVRGIAYKLFLTLEQLLGAIHGLLCRKMCIRDSSGSAIW